MDKTNNRGASSKYLSLIFGFLCASGVLLSLYAYHVETNKEKDESYTAMCDISQHMSCTAVFSSKYGKGFGIVGQFVGEESAMNQPNSVYGVTFYTLLFLLSEVSDIKVSKVIIVLAILSNICSVYLAMILIYVLHDFCVVCVTTYVVNFFLLICSVFRYRNLKFNMKTAVKKDT